MAGQEILSPAAMPQDGPGLNGSIDRLKAISMQPAIQKAMPLLMIIGTLGIAGGAYLTLQQPDQIPLYQGLNEGDKGAIAEALQAAGIEYSLDAGSGTVQVDEDQLHRARMMLANQGLPKAAPSGDALLSSLPMGSSRAVEGETLRGAREADMARTIEAIDAVKSARIHLATPERSVFVRETSKPAASVMLTLYSGRSLSAGQVRAIRHLVSSSVPGMSPEEVSIIDQSGALLSQRDENNGANQNFEMQTQVEQRHRQALKNLLAPIVGEGNYSAEVSAVVDFSESQSTRETYPKNDSALRREEGGRSSDAADPNGQAGGVPGALANEPPAATQIVNQPPAAGPNAAQNAGENGAPSNETYKRSFDVGREISVTHQPFGRLQRLTVAVALRTPKGEKARSAADVKSIEDLVKGAVGYNADRGDVVAVSAAAFAEIPVAQAAWWDQPWMIPLLRQIGGVLAALLLLFFLGRPLLKNLKERRVRADERREAIEQQLLSATAGNSATDSDSGNPARATADEVTLEMIESAPSYEARAELVRHFVRQDAGRAAMVVRQLMQEPKHGG